MDQQPLKANAKNSDNALMLFIRLHNHVLHIVLPALQTELNAYKREYVKDTQPKQLVLQALMVIAFGLVLYADYFFAPMQQLKSRSLLMLVALYILKQILNVLLMAPIASR